MTINVKVGYQQLVEEANREVTARAIADALDLVGRAETVLVDLRDVRELRREGRIPGAFHMPRGMVEFWIDPASPYFKPLFAEEREFVFYCNKGWRSALAAHVAQRMGLERVSHIEGGFEAWVAAGGPVEPYGK